MTDYHRFDLDRVELQSGITLRNAVLAYKTYGTLNADKSNAVVYPTAFSGRHWDNEWLIGPGRGLDPQKYFIIVPNLLGNGLSSSPSNTPQPYDRIRFPDVTMYDNVACQERLVREGFGIERLQLVVGFSMAAGQTYQWAVSFPEAVARMLPFCGASATSPHNQVFIEGIRAALTADGAWEQGWYTQQPQLGLRALARVYAGWGLSQSFYWQELWRQLEYTSLEDFLVHFWEGWFLNDQDANDLLAMLWTWQHADVGNTPGFGGDTVAALRSIRARGLVLSAEKDLYFPPEDELWAAKHLADAEVRVIPGVWGHYAGLGLNPPDVDFIDGAVKELLQLPA